MDKPLILVVEDDRAVRSLVTTTLDTHDYKYITAQNGQQALLEIVSRRPNIILLDLGLPDMDGIEIIKKVRSWSIVPIIVISARSEDKSKIEALDTGADDYLTKPFSIDELLARLRATMRRLKYLEHQEIEDVVFTNGDLKVNFDSGCTYLNDQELHLTPIEYKLLCLLAKNIDKVLTHNYILKEVWGDVIQSDVPSLRVFMATLRKKIESDTTNPKYIQTHVGVGYRMLRVEREKE
ncbi:response regulator [Thomasclavelia ramosa]|uniref:response regulator n=1 Tax=Thomasclavelia ramosa TaxID=1547 RepID=UPI0018AB5917|nr:response regulator transcription factor [Thomasclavelia ramosa]